MMGYEAACSHTLLRRTPVVVRVDGRAFHTLTRGMSKPFDVNFSTCMSVAAKVVVEGMQGAKLAYVQSDEASFLLTDYDRFETDAWFGYVHAKVESIAAATMSVHFADALGAWENPLRLGGLPVFDARAFNVPREEVANYFLWRARDWARNSLQMLARAYFSHKELHEKCKAELHEMLHSKGGNWATDILPVFRNGAFLSRAASGSWVANYDIPAQYAAIAALVDPLLVPQEESSE